MSTALATQEGNQRFSVDPLDANASKHAMLRKENLDITCLFLFVIMFACVLFYDELSEMLSPIAHDIICGDFAAPQDYDRARRVRRK